MNPADVQLVHALAYLLATSAGMFSVGAVVGLLVLKLSGAFRK